MKTSLRCLFRDTFDSSATSMPSLSDLVALEPPKLSKIHPILTYTKGDTRVVRLNNLRLRLLLHCSFLNQHTSSFRTSARYSSRSPICPVCGGQLPLCCWVLGPSQGSRQMVFSAGEGFFYSCVRSSFW